MASLLTRHTPAFLAMLATLALFLLSALAAVAGHALDTYALRHPADPSSSLRWAPTFANYNDWACRSTKPPVILLHGMWVPSGLNWAMIGPALARDGHCVFTPQYGTRLGVLFG
jgi:hypothetical protein